MRSALVLYITPRTLPLHLLPRENKKNRCTCRKPSNKLDDIRVEKITPTFKPKPKLPLKFWKFPSSPPFYIFMRLRVSGLVAFLLHTRLTLPNEVVVSFFKMMASGNSRVNIIGIQTLLVSDAFKESCCLILTERVGM